MQSNIILAGVGGQGILTIAAVIDRAALQSGLTIRQTEVHELKIVFSLSYPKQQKQTFH